MVATRRILVMDDEAVVTSSCRRILAAEGDDMTSRPVVLLDVVIHVVEHIEVSLSVHGHVSRRHKGIVLILAAALEHQDGIQFTRGYNLISRRTAVEQHKTDHEGYEQNVIH